MNTAIIAKDYTIDLKPGVSSDLLQESWDNFLKY